MAVSIATLRSYGGRRVTLRSSDGTFDGSIVAEHLTGDSVMLQFVPVGVSQSIVIAIDDIAEVVER